MVKVFPRQPRRKFRLRVAPPAVFNEDVEGLRSAIRNLTRTFHFDLVQIEYASMAQYVDEVGCGSKILTELDVSFISAYRKFKTAKSPYLKMRYFLAFLLFFYYELKYLRRFDKIIVMSGQDKQFLKRFLPRLLIDTIPNGVDCEYFENRFNPSASNSLLFVGSFRHFPNVEAVRYLCQEIFPLIKKALSDVKLYIVGGDPPPEVQALADDRIIITGFVEDVRQYYRQAFACIFPIRIGSGSRIKILEAFASGVPVVTTPIGYEGIAAEPGTHLLVGEKPAELAAKVIELFGNEDLRKTLSQKSRQLVEEKYHWKDIADRLGEVYEAVAEEARLRDDEG